LELPLVALLVALGLAMISNVRQAAWDFHCSKFPSSTSWHESGLHGNANKDYQSFWQLF